MLVAVEELVVSERSLSELMTYLESFLLCHVKSFTNDSRVDTFLDIPVGLLQKLSNKQDDRSGSISYLLILGDSSSGNHGCGGVLTVS
jgi:hypothetical protein